MMRFPGRFWWEFWNDPDDNPGTILLGIREECWWEPEMDSDENDRIIMRRILVQSRWESGIWWKSWRLSDWIWWEPWILMSAPGLWWESCWDFDENLRGTLMRILGRVRWEFWMDLMRILERFWLEPWDYNVWSLKRMLMIIQKGMGMGIVQLLWEGS